MGASALVPKCLRESRAPRAHVLFSGVFNTLPMVVRFLSYCVNSVFSRGESSSFDDTKTSWRSE